VAGGFQEKNEDAEGRLSCCDDEHERGSAACPRRWSRGATAGTTAIAGYALFPCHRPGE
jgi:hypothetical protein